MPTASEPKGKFILRPGLPGVYVPGAVEEDAGSVPVPPSENDEDMDDPRSPKKHRTRQVRPAEQLDVNTLRGLLADQAASINETQRAAIADAMSGLRKDLEKHRAEIKQEMAHTNSKVQSLEDSVLALQGRVQQLEAKGAESGAAAGASGDGADSDRHKFTLVYGGWERDTPRKQLLQQLGEVLDRLELRPLLDTEPFCTGPRRSVALQGFVIRERETYVGMRNRMSVVVAALSNSEAKLGDSGTKIWDSKTQRRPRGLGKEDDQGYRTPGRRLVGD